MYFLIEILNMMYVTQVIQLIAARCGFFNKRFIYLSILKWDARVVNRDFGPFGRKMALLKIPVQSYYLLSHYN